MASNSEARKAVAKLINLASLAAHRNTLDHEALASIRGMNRIFHVVSKDDMLRMISLEPQIVVQEIVREVVKSLPMHEREIANLKEMHQKEIAALKNEIARLKKPTPEHTGFPVCVPAQADKAQIEKNSSTAKPESKSNSSKPDGRKNKQPPWTTEQEDFLLKTIRENPEFKNKDFAKRCTEWFRNGREVPENTIKHQIHRLRQQGRLTFWKRRG